MQTFMAYVSKIRRSKYSFPGLALIVIVLLSFFSISGTSLGVYGPYFHGANHTDDSLLFGSPQGIRSDEWLVFTQMTIAQQAEGYPYINENIGNGQNMSVMVDVPYLEWSALFKPQNWVFFITPLEFAFAFKWWLLGFLLLAGTYFLILEILPGRKKVATLLSLIFVLSPFVQWWYQAQTLAPLFYSIFILLCLIKIHKAPVIRNKLLFGLLLTWLLACFALLLYPPFQIPCVLVTIAAYILFLIQFFKKKIDRNIRASFFIIAGAGILALTVTGLFIVTRLDDIRTILETAYPGARSILSGGYPITHVLSTFAGPLLQSDTLLSHYAVGNNVTNKSEASNFILPYIPIVLTALSLFVLLYRKKKEIAYDLLLPLGVLGLFLARMSLPFGDAFYKLLALGSVPHARLMIGLGLVTLVLFVMTIRRLYENRVKLSDNLKWYIILTSTVVYAALIFYIVGTYPGFIPSTAIAVALLLVMVVFTYLLVNRYIVSALLLLLAFSIASSFRIHPLYQGLDIVTETTLAKKIQTLSQESPNAKWIVNNDLYLENYALMNGAPSLGGTFYYPQSSIFSEIDQSKDDSYSNRYAHILYRISNASQTNIELLQPDLFRITTDACGEFLKDNSVKYIISPTPIASRCVTEVYHQPLREKDTLYIYRIPS